MEYAEVEVWVVVDGSGDAGAGLSEEAAKENYEGCVGELPVVTRCVKVMLKVPLPTTADVTVTVPALPQDAVAVLGNPAAGTSAVLCSPYIK